MSREAQSPTGLSVLRSDALDGALDREWYHTIELRPGLLTPGWFDTRPVAARLPFPDLTGKRCLDVATFDGFWAFEMERRGAAEVMAIDVLEPEDWDWPVNSSAEVRAALERRKQGGHGFQIARDALGSSVQFRELSVYDLDPAVMGDFDFVYLGSLLLHLRDPVRALERVRSVCRGRLLLVENIDLALSLLHSRAPVAMFEGRDRPWWWKLNLSGLLRVVRAAGFQILDRPRRIYMPPGPGHPRPRPGLELLRSAEARQLMLTSIKGDPHAAVLAEPVGKA
jgi:tRNA (mo5U34)-methyltransferase